MNLIGIPLLLILIATILLISFSILALSYFLRKRQLHRQRQREEIEDRYRPLFFEWISGDNPPVSLPEKKREWNYLIALWNDLYQKIGSEERKRMQKLGLELEINKNALDFLESGELQKILNGIITLGKLEISEGIDRIKDFSHSSKPVVRLQAIKALTRMDPKIGLERIFDETLKKPDSPKNYYLKFCQNLPRELVTEKLLAKLENTEREKMHLLVPFLAEAEREEALDFLGGTMPNSNDPELLAAGLRVIRKIGTPAQQPLVKEYLAHSVNFVRIQAARTLGAIGTKGAIEPLKKALSDKDWWVRHRAGEALVNLPETTIPELEKEIDSIDDPYGRDALAEAISEVQI